MSQSAVKHPGVNSGIDLITSGVADTLGINVGTEKDYTGHQTLVATKDGIPVAYWKPDYWRDNGYEQAGWYCIRTKELLLRDNFWGKGETE
jgi:hypothetical protein